MQAMPLKRHRPALRLAGHPAFYRSRTMLVPSANCGPSNSLGNVGNRAHRSQDRVSTSKILCRTFPVSDFLPLPSAQFREVKRLGHYVPEQFHPQDLQSPPNVKEATTMGKIHMILRSPRCTRRCWADFGPSKSEASAAGLMEHPGCTSDVGSVARSSVCRSFATRWKSY